MKIVKEGHLKIHRWVWQQFLSPHCENYYYTIQTVEKPELFHTVDNELGKVVMRPSCAHLPHDVRMRVKKVLPEHKYVYCKKGADENSTDFYSDLDFHFSSCAGVNFAAYERFNVGEHEIVYSTQEVKREIESCLTHQELVNWHLSHFAWMKEYEEEVRNCTISTEYPFLITIYDEKSSTTRLCESFEQAEQIIQHIQDGTDHNAFALFQRCRY